MRLRRRSSPSAAVPVLIIAFALLWGSGADARRGAPPASLQGFGSPSSTIPVLELAPPDVPALIAEDEALAAGGSKALRFADPRSVLVRPDTHGKWDDLEGGTRLWRLRIAAPGATDLNLGFTRFHLPAGASLHFIGEDGDHWEGPYTHEDNAAHGELWLPPVPGDRAIVELRVPAVTKLAPDLELTHVGVGYRDFLGGGAGPRRQGSCNIDVACPEAASWAAEIQAVAVYVLDGSWTCTGTMIMDVPGSFTPYFLTANHCGIDAGNASSMIVYWNYQSPSCGQLSGGDISDNQTGAFFRASRGDVDVALVELDDVPDPGSNVFWTGWDATDTPPQGSVGIHHPSTDEKAISFNDDPLTKVDSCIGGGSNTHWLVDDWEDGTTEPGSSGSGLWDPETHLLVGFLSGGQASCANNSYDCYGRLSVAWNGSSPSSRLRDWLDPGASGTLQVSGSFADGSGFPALAGMVSADACADPISNENGVWEPGELITLEVELRAVGAELANVTGTLSTTSPYLTIIDGAAGWPDIQATTTATTEAPHFRIFVAPGAVCAESVDLTLEVLAGSDGPFAFTLSERIGTLLVADDLPVSTVDNGSVSSQLELEENVSITDVDVQVEMTHTWVGDLIITLTSPANTTVTLLDRPGYILVGSGCQDDDMNVMFDDESAFDPETHCAGTTPWYSGDAMPVTPLSALDGESTVGTWTLTVTDEASGDGGELVAWQLITTPELIGGCNPCESIVAVGGELPSHHPTLAQNRPNPFKPRTSIAFVTTRTGRVSLDIFGASGRLVRRLVDADFGAGTHEVHWEGTDANGHSVRPGVYFYRLRSGGDERVRRMTRLE